MRYILLFCLLPLSSFATLLSAESCLQHGTVGLFCQAFTTGYVEPRNAATHPLVFEFDSALGTLPSISAVDAASNVVPVLSGAISGSTLSIVIQPVDTQVVTIIIGVSPPVSVTLAFLIGDVDGDGVVTQADVDAIKLISGQATDITNFLYDLNLNGVINVSDITMVKARLGHHL